MGKYNNNNLYNIIKDQEKNKYSEEPKTALVRPIFTKNERNKIGNYRTISILNEISKIYERCIHDILSSYAETISNFILAYKKSYFVGLVLMDLFKAFDCIPHDLLVAKLHVYGLSEDVVTVVYSYLKRRKQGVQINDTKGIFQILLSDVPQSSILGSILFSILIFDLFFFIKDV